MTVAPLVLSFDTSGPACSVALLRGRDVLRARDEAMTRGQAERLVPLIQEALSECGIAPSDLSAVAVGTGPGNFTGVRIAVSAARGLALALGCPAIGISMPEALAHGQPRPLLTCQYGRRGSVTVTRFDAEMGTPLQALPNDLPTVLGRDFCACVGPAAQEVSAVLGVAVLDGVSPVVSAAHLAMERLRRPDLPRPAPYYLRPADAAPPSQRAPAILP